MAGPTALEQLTLEYINRMRMDPGGEYARLIDPATLSQIQGALTYFGVNMTALQSQLAALSAVAPLAWNDNLATAARGHNDAMIAADLQSHQVPGEASLGTRITNAGYTGWSALGENVYAYANNAFYGHAGFVIDWGYDATDFVNGSLISGWQSNGDGIQDPAGHRNNLMSATFTEIGIGVTLENNSATQVGPMLITHDLGTRFGYQAQFMGVIIDDLDSDDFYDVGEGMGGVTITLTSGTNSYQTTSWASGGWQIAVPAGSYDISFTGGALNGTITAHAILGSSNVKLDVEAADAVLPAPVINGTDGDDILAGTTGDDIINGFAGHDILNGGQGADRMTGGEGNDSYVVDHIGDLVIEMTGQGTDTVRARIDYVLPDDVEQLYLSSAARIGTGNALDNVLLGSGGSDLLSGLDGNDRLGGGVGRDTLLGGLGDDRLNGGLGKDSMTGGLGRDLYIFETIGDSAATTMLADVITDFSKSDGERIILNAIDADSLTAGDQGFAFIGTAAFSSVAGQLRYQQISGNSYVQMDVNGDALADMMIRLDGLHTLTAGDFLL